MGETGSVGFMFEHIGLIEYESEKILEDAMLEAAIDAGAENCETMDGLHSITTTMETMATVRDTLAKQFGDPITAKFTFIAKITAPVGVDGVEALTDLVEALEDNDDVQEVFTNAEFDDAALQKLSA
jgi:transcriptional/translational regulatory protein YebC/TACO1